MRFNRRQFFSLMAAGAAFVAGKSSLISASASEITAKSDIEKLVNPFGDPWASRAILNPTIPIATSSALRFFTVEPYNKMNWFDGAGELTMPAGYVNFHSFAGSPFHYDESIGKLAVDMPLLKRVRDAFEKAGIHKKFIGYTTVNFAESKFMPGFAEADESFFIHLRDKPPTRENRLKHEETGTTAATGDVFDIRNEKYHAYVAEKIVDAMVRNNLDAVLIDYAAAWRPYGTYWPKQFPDDWFPTFHKNQRALLSTVSAHAERHGKKIICNGVTQDGISVTDLDVMRGYMKVCHGFFWEQPFRHEWRDEYDDPATYYKKLSEFFGLSAEFNKPIFVKQGTYRMIGDENVHPGNWRWRFKVTTEKREREHLHYFLPFYLMYMQGQRTPMIYTHPTDIKDIYHSQAYFHDYDQDIGAPLAPCEILADHILYRQFSKATVVLNNRDTEYEIHVPALGGQYARPQRSIKLAPLSGKILPV